MSKTIDERLRELVLQLNAIENECYDDVPEGDEFEYELFERLNLAQEALRRCLKEYL
jgi:hypothetical protein